jgi:FlhB-like protein
MEPLKRPPRRAVALAYDLAQDPAPRVVAKGRGELAERILELARKSGVHIHEDPDLVAVLSRLELDAQIAAELYRAVAEVLAFVYRLSGRHRAG